MILLVRAGECVGIDPSSGSVEEKHASQRAATKPINSNNPRAEKPESGDDTKRYSVAISRFDLWSRQLRAAGGRFRIVRMANTFKDPSRDRRCVFTHSVTGADGLFEISFGIV